MITEKINTFRANLLKATKGGKERGTHTETVTVHGRHGVFTRQQRVGQNEDEAPKMTRELHDLLLTIRDKNLHTMIRSWSEKKLKDKYIELIKEQNDWKRRWELARSTNDTEGEKAAKGKVRSLDTNKTRMLQAAGYRNIDLESHLQTFIEKLRERQERAGQESGVANAPGEETAPKVKPEEDETVYSRYNEETGQIEFTEAGEALRQFSDVNMLSTEEQDALANLIITPIISPADMPAPEPIQFNYQGMDYDGMATSNTDGSKVPHGQGRLTVVESAEYRIIYEGNFTYGQFNGAGRLITYDKVSGEITKEYQGGFVNSEFEGQGTFENHKTGLRIDGYFRRGILNGHGEVWEPSGAHSTGNFRDGMLYGLGTVEQADGTIYDGNFAQGKLHGEGSILQENGTTFEGKFRNGKQHGVFKVIQYDKENNPFETENYYVDGIRVSEEDWKKRYTGNKTENLQNLGFTVLGYNEDWVEQNLGGIDIAKWDAVMKSAVEADGSKVINSEVRVSNNTFKIKWNFAKTPQTGPHPPQCERTFTKHANGKLTVHHDYMILPVEGKGTAKVFMKEMLAQYRAAGVSSVDVYAAISGGGYAWACFGFRNELSGPAVYNNYLNPQRLSGDMLRRVTKLKEDIGDDKYNELVNFTKNYQGKFPMHVFSQLYGKSGKAGANFLRGLSWRGEIDLTSQEQVQIWEDYINPEVQARRNQERQAEMARRQAETEPARRRGRQTQMTAGV